METEKPRKPRTKSSPLWLPIRFDPSGGYGSEEEKFEILLHSTSEIRARLNQIRLKHPLKFIVSLATVLLLGDETLAVKPAKPRTKNSRQLFSFIIEEMSLELKMSLVERYRFTHYMVHDRQGFLRDLDREYLWGETGVKDETHYGKHAKTHALEDHIRSLTTKLYFLIEYWHSQDKQHRRFEKFSEIIETFDEKYDGYDLIRDIKRIVHIAILESKLGKDALAAGLKLYRSRKGDAYYLNTSGFFKSYFSASFYTSLMSTTSSLNKRNKREWFAHFTEVWLKYLVSNPFSV